MNTKSVVFEDQMGRKVLIPKQVERIVSLVPSQTELLFDLGLDSKVVGITKFCIHPKEACKQVTKIGGTKQFKRAIIDELKPDLIIGNKEENEVSQIESLAKDYPVWMSDIYNLPDALEMIQEIGKINQAVDRASVLATQIKKAFAEIPQAEKRLKVAYFIWREPYMVAAKDTYIDAMLEAAGFDNAFAHLWRYPAIDLPSLKEVKPDVIFLSSEPFPFQEKYFPPFKAVLPNTPIKVVDGEMFSWYGSRLLLAAKYFRDLKTPLLGK